jgi:hypothetical protein
MQLILATVKGRPRTVQTKHGERSVVDAQSANGETLTIWRPADDPAVMRLANGERVQLAIDSKGRVSLVENDRPEVSPLVTPQTQPARPMGFSVAVPFEAENKLRQQLAAAAPQPGGRSAEIADYIDRLGKLYSRCYKTAAQELDSTPLATPEIKDVATTLFIQATRHFSI